MSATFAFVTYKDIRDYTVARLAAAFASRKDIVVEAHPGRFDEAELRRLFAARTPAILTSLMNIAESSGDDNQRLDFVTWVLVRGSTKDPLFDDALVVLSVLVPLLRSLNADWAFGGAENVEAKNLYTSQTGGINAALWAVSWSWRLRGSVALTNISEEKLAEGGILIPSTLADFEGYDAALQVGSREADDQITLK